MNLKKLSLKHIVYALLYAILIFSFIYCLVLKNYYIALYSVLVSVFLTLPELLKRMFHLIMPAALELSIVLFMFSSVFLGHALDFYSKFPHWDAMLHTFSGFLMAAVGIALIDICNRHSAARALSPIFAVLFAFCFSMTVGVLWEFYEYAVDTLFDYDMQKDTYITVINSDLVNGAIPLPVESVTLNGTKLEGYIDIGLIDTMSDMIDNAVGALILSVFSWFYLKGKGCRWVGALLFFRKHAAPVEASPKP